MTTVNCPVDECDFPIDMEGLDDGDVFECPECGTDLEVSNDGTKLTEAETNFFDDDEEEAEEVDG